MLLPPSQGLSQLPIIILQPPCCDHISTIIQRRKIVDDFVMKLQNLLDKNEVSNMVQIVRYNDSDLSSSKSIYEKLASKIRP